MNGETRPPRTFLEAIFDVIDSVARRAVDMIPLGRGIKNVVKSKGEDLIGWDHVREIAEATLELQRNLPEPISSYMIDQYQNMLLAAQAQVEAYTGLTAANLPERVEVFSQQDWIRANIASFRFLFDPISDRYLSAVEELEGSREVPGAGAGARKFARSILSIQVGLIMGYLSRNVLGQFDLSLPEPEKGSKLYVVEPNVRRLEVEMGLDPREFRQWITLHEVTHSYEFHCNGWLREYLTSSLQEYLSTIDWRGIPRPDLMRMARRRAEKEDALRAGGLLSIISTPEQRAILSRLQAAMSLLEGYSNHVMDQVGKELLATYPRMKERFERRRESKNGAEKLFQRLIGISLKLQQYKLGQAFVDAVVEKEGIAFLNRVWEGPEFMPSLEEIHSPAGWIGRVGRPPSPPAGY